MPLTYTVIQLKNHDI